MKTLNVVNNPTETLKPMYYYQMPDGTLVDIDKAIHEKYPTAHTHACSHGDNVYSFRVCGYTTDVRTIKYANSTSRTMLNVVEQDADMLINTDNGFEITIPNFEGADGYTKLYPTQDEAIANADVQ